MCVCVFFVNRIKTMIVMMMRHNGLIIFFVYFVKRDEGDLDLVVIVVDRVAWLFVFVVDTWLNEY